MTNPDPHPRSKPPKKTYGELMACLRAGFAALGKPAPEMKVYDMEEDGDYLSLEGTGVQITCERRAIPRKSITGSTVQIVWGFAVEVDETGEGDIAEMGFYESAALAAEEAALLHLRDRVRNAIADDCYARDLQAEQALLAQENAVQPVAKALA